jgi:hypothetical protein
MEIFVGITVVALPVLFVLFIAWHEGVALHWLGYGLFTVLASILFVRYMSNLEEWQMGLFGLLFALAIIGAVHLFNQRGS